MKPARDGQLRGLRVRNRLRVIRQLREQGKASQAEIARRTGLSRTTISAIVAELHSEGLLVRVDRASDDRRPSGGRPPVLLRLDDRSEIVVGIEIGHGHLRAAIATVAHEVLAESDCAIADDAGAGPPLEAAAGMVRALLAKAGFDPSRVVGVGLGVPVRVNRGCCVAGPNPLFSAWAGSSAGGEMAERLGMAVEMENRTNLAALAETLWGAACGSTEVVYLGVSNRIDAGIILNGRIYAGAAGVAGEIGHIAVEPAGAHCYCGSRGCLETVAAVPSLVEGLSAINPATPAEILARARSGDSPSQRVVAEAGRKIGVALAGACSLLNPQCVVIGGRLAGAGPLLLDPIRESISRCAIPAAAGSVRVVPAAFAERAEAMGALALALLSSGRLAMPAPMSYELV